MNENKSNFLIKASSLLVRSEENKVCNILKSHYLMRCPLFRSQNQTPNNNEKIRCPHCCLEWTKNANYKIKSIKLSKKQKKKLSCNDKQNIFKSNQLERICSFCGHTSTITIPKLIRNKCNLEQHNKTNIIPKLTKEKKIELKNVSKEENKIINKPLNVYSKAADVFSLKNENNKLAKNVKTVEIKNNKKKKDKFAGLCQQAVLASAKMKTEKDKKNKLNLFLKPSD